MKKNNNNIINWKNLTFEETFNLLQKSFKDEELKIEDVLDVDFSNEIEFLLHKRGRWLLCHMGKDYPYYIKYRLIGDRIYERVKPEKFVSVAKDRLLH